MDVMSSGGFAGQGDARVQPQPAMPTINAPSNPAREAGVVTDYGYAVGDQGGLIIVPSNDMKQRMEDNVILETQWAFRNQALPMFSGLRPPSTREFPINPRLVARGYTEWRWSATHQGFFPYNPRTGVFIGRNSTWN